MSVSISGPSNGLMMARTLAAPVFEPEVERIARRNDDGQVRLDAQERARQAQYPT